MAYWYTVQLKKSYNLSDNHRIWRHPLNLKMLISVKWFFHSLSTYEELCLFCFKVLHLVTVTDILIPEKWSGKWNMCLELNKKYGLMKHIWIFLLNIHVLCLWKMYYDIFFNRWVWKADWRFLWLDESHYLDTTLHKPPAHSISKCWWINERIQKNWW